MPTIQLVDGFGLNIEATPNPVSAFAKYFSRPPKLSLIQRDLASMQNVPLANFPLESTEIGLSFDQPTSLSRVRSQLTIGAGVGGYLGIYRQGDLFDTGAYGDPIPIPDQHAYLALGVNAHVGSGESVGTANNIGFTTGTTVSLVQYKRFETTATAPTFKSALEASLKDYIIPVETNDLASLGIGDIATIECTGTLRFSGNINLLTSVNPLVSLSSTIVPAKIQIKEGATIDVGASFAIEEEFQIRIQKVAAGKVRLGFYRKRGIDFTVQVSSSAGISAGIGDRYINSAVLGAISAQPFPSTDELEQAGLTEEKAGAITAALKTAVQRRLELAIEGELQALSSHEAAFLYEIDLDTLEPEGKLAVQNALRLDLSLLGQDEGSFPRGIREIHSILTNTREKACTLKLNILGLYNYASMNDLALQGTVLTDPESGELVITDQAQATRIAAEISYLAETEKLRKLLAQSFLITAAYRCSKQIAEAPTLKASYWHFAVVAKTNRKTMAANLDTVEALGLISPAQKQEKLGGIDDFGRSTFYIGTDYDDAVAVSLFLQSGGQPRKTEEFEEIGRKALCMTIHPGDDDDFRLRPLQDDALWDQVKETGGTLDNLARVLPGLRRDVQIPIINGDFTLIEWWATTMAGMADSLAKARAFFSQDPPPSFDSPQRARVQAELWHQMQNVARNTHDRFAEPWGLIAMDLASGRHSSASAQITSPYLTLRLKRSDR